MALVVTIERHDEFLENKIKGIKWIREVTGCSLREAKELADALSEDAGDGNERRLTLRINDDTSALRFICSATEAHVYVYGMTYLDTARNEDFVL